MEVLKKYRNALAHQRRKAAQFLEDACETGDDQLIEICDDRLEWVNRKFFLLDEHGILLKDVPARRYGVFYLYGAEDDRAVVHRMSDQEIAWNNYLKVGLEPPSDS